MILFKSAAPHKIHYGSILGLISCWIAVSPARFLRRHFFLLLKWGTDTQYQNTHIYTHVDTYIQPCVRLCLYACVCLCFTIMTGGVYFWGGRIFCLRELAYGERAQEGVPGGQKEVGPLVTGCHLALPVASSPSSLPWFSPALCIHLPTSLLQMPSLSVPQLIGFSFCHRNANGGRNVTARKIPGRR